MRTTPIVQNIAFVGTYVPRKCGIATFAADLLGAVAGQYPGSPCVAVAMNDGQGCMAYPPEVHCEIEEQNLQSYKEAAGFLNETGTDVVSLQHEFGIFGGPSGSHIHALLREVQAPVVATLHTVLMRPNGEQQRVMENLIAYSSRLVVMTERGRRILREVYDVPDEQIEVIPHGIPEVSFGRPDDYKQGLGIGGRQVLLTFGLLSPNKGIEHVIHALPEIVEEFPDVVYVVLGATHPHEVRSRGEAYRAGLEAVVHQHGLQRNVIFENRFVELPELTNFIGAANVYITPYLDEAQISSGTLAYAFGAGKAVISTPYWHAKELLDGGRGVLVPFGSADAIAQEVRGLLRDEQRRERMSANAYEMGRQMVWSKTADRYKACFEAAQREKKAQVSPGVPHRPLVTTTKVTPVLNLSHLHEMTDEVGILQHAYHSHPNLQEGYCTDDNARALILAVLLEQTIEAPTSVEVIGQTYEAFLLNAFEKETGRFHNFMAIDCQWLDTFGSEDSHGRAIWAMGVALGQAPKWSDTKALRQLFIDAVPAMLEFTSPRAWAFGLLGMLEYLQGRHESRLVRETIDELTRRLIEVFDHTAQQGWVWFEEELSYDNAKLAHALIASGSTTGQPRVVERGMTALRWLMQVQTAKQGWLRPIGSNGFYRRNSVRSDFDQQPIEAQSTVSACLEAYRATGNPSWYEEAQRAFDWFHGWNDLGLELYCAHTGGCRDALHADRSNENQGAESTLAYLLSLAEIRCTNQRLGKLLEIRQTVTQ